MTSIRRPLNLSRVIKRYALTADLTLKRFSGGAWIDGRWADEQPTDVALTANVQPMGGKQKQTLPEGDRTREAIHIWATSQMRPVERENGKPGDRVEWEGKEYEIINVQDWSYNGNYWEADAVKVEQ